MNWNDFTTGYVCGAVLALLLIIIGLPWRVKDEN